MPVVSVLKSTFFPDLTKSRCSLLQWACRTAQCIAEECFACLHIPL